MSITKDDLRRDMRQIVDEIDVYLDMIHTSGNRRLILASIAAGLEGVDDDLYGATIRYRDILKSIAEDTRNYAGIN